MRSDEEMGEITIVRHGQASYGTSDYDRLSPLGHQQSDWLGAHFAARDQRFDHVVSGTLRRHRETLSGLRNHIRPDRISEDPRLNEMSYHAMERAYEAQTGEALPDTPESAARYFVKVMQAWETDALKGAPEPYSAFKARVLAAVFDHAKEGQHVLLVSSGGPIGVAMRHVLGFGAEAMINVILRTYNASYSRFELFEGQPHLTQFNAIGHLEMPDRRHAVTYL